MAVYSIRIESDADWSAVEIMSAATWARAPGHVLSFAAVVGRASGLRLWIDDRAVRLDPDPGTAVPHRLVVQVATTQDRVLLHTTKALRGTVRLVSAVDACVNDGADDGNNGRDVVLYLDPAAAALAGARGGDAALG
jgi:hypothetical protein